MCAAVSINPLPSALSIATEPLRIDERPAAAVLGEPPFEVLRISADREFGSSLSVER